MNMIEKVKEIFDSGKEEILDIINIEDKYQIAKVKTNDKMIWYFPFIEGKKCFYNFGVHTIEEALISVIAEDRKCDNYINSCLKLLNIVSR